MKNLLAAALVITAGCAWEIPDVDRTQPNKVHKRVFEGEWYYRQTVIQVPFTSAFTFIGEQPDVTERIRFDVQERFLIAWRTYDLVAGTDHAAGVSGDEDNNTPVAIFPIESHFDVKREYNAQTGEQTNVIVENSVDRPWFERDFMRVDWSVNLAPSFGFLVSAVTQVPGSHFVQKPGDVDSVLMAMRNGSGWEDVQGSGIASLTHAEYLDVVHRILVEPETIELEWDDGTSSTEPACWYYGNVDCNPGEIAVRSAFLKLDPANTYVAQKFPDNEILRDDEGNPIRVTYAADGVSLIPDPDGFIARADYFDKFGYFRTERDTYDRRFGETNTGRVLLINRFNIWQDAPACVDESAELPYANCTVKPIVYFTSPGFPADLRPMAQSTADQWNVAFKETVRALKYGPTRPLAEVEDVFVLRDNSFRMEGDRVTARGERIGDLRYNLMYYVDEPNQAALLGYGPAATDPLTGEIISANAFVYGAAVDTLAQRSLDIIDLINDPNRLTEFMDGEDVMRSVHLRERDGEDAREDSRRFVRDRATRMAGIKSRGKQSLRSDGSRMRTALAALKDTPLESKLMTDPILRALGDGRVPSGGLSDAQITQFSPRHWSMGQSIRKEKRRRQHLARHRAELMDFADPSIVGLAFELKDEDPERVFQILRQRIFASTMEHEVGHTLGLRHNFEASTDALNYGEEYWRLRGDSGQALAPLTTDQLQGGIRQFQQASIMDYGARFNSDIEGIGLYDKAAIAFGYGDLVYAFNTAPDEPLLEAYDLPAILRHYRHYTEFPSVFHGTAGIHDRTLVRHRKVIEQLSGRTTWSTWEVPFRFCSDEYEGATSTCAVYDEGADAYEIAAAARNAYVEYFPLMSFARDRRYFNEWDYLSRVYERSFGPMLVQYQNWLFDQFNYEFEWDYLRSDPAHFRIQDVPWAEAGAGGLPGAAGTRMLLDLINDVLATPEPGSYVYDPVEQAHILNWYGEVDLCNGFNGPDCADLVVPLGTGRYTDSRWDFDSGYYFYDRLFMVGSFYDKLIALETAVTSDTYFLGVDTGADVQRYAIGLNLLFPEEIYRMVGGVAAQDYPQYAGISCDTTRTYVPPRISAPNANPCDGGTFKRVDPATSFTVELFAVWYGMAFLPAAFDTTFTDRMKIYLEGSGEAFTPADPLLVVTFTNPLNSRVYKAVRAPGMTAYSPGAELLAKAQRFADEYAMTPTEPNRWRLENIMSTIEDVRGTFDVYGYLYF